MKLNVIEDRIQESLDTLSSTMTNRINRILDSEGMEIKYFISNGKLSSTPVTCNYDGNRANIFIHVTPFIKLLQHISTPDTLEYMFWCYLSTVIAKRIYIAKSEVNSRTMIRNGNMELHQETQMYNTISDKIGNVSMTMYEIDDIYRTGLNYELLPVYAKKLIRYDNQCGIRKPLHYITSLFRVLKFELLYKKDMVNPYL
jgi:hypothetical protein